MCCEKNFQFELKIQSVVTKTKSQVFRRQFKFTQRKKEKKNNELSTKVQNLRVIRKVRKSAVILCEQKNYFGILKKKIR